MLAINLALFLLSCIILVISGSLLVRYLSKIAQFLHASEYVIAFILMAFATSVPELFVGISSAIAKTPALVLGTVIGSNIANVTLIMGIGVLLSRGITIETDKIRWDAIYMVLILILPIALTFIGKELSRIDALILLAAFFLYSYKIIKERKRFTKEAEEKISRFEIVLAVFIFVVSLVMLFISADFVIEYALKLAIDFAVPPIVIGLFLIALGTSLPELVFGTQSIVKAHPQLAIGNIIGSGIANSTLILAVSALIFPITADFFLFITSGVYMIVANFIFATFLQAGKKLYWMEGVSLVMLYVFFIIIEYYLKGLGI